MLSITATQLDRFMNCSGFLDLIPFESSEKDNSMRDEGVAVHWAIEEAYKTGREIEEFTDRKAPNGVYITSEMAEHAQDYYLHVKDIAVHLEHDTTHSGEGWEIRGRADAAGIKDNIIYVSDFKYGWSQVEVKNNWTLVSHACALASKNPQIENIVLSIYQPRGFHHDGHIRTWKMTAGELYTLYLQIDEKLKNPVKTLSTGKHCKYCPGFINCPASQKSCMNAIDVSEHEVFNSTVSPENLSILLDDLYRASEILKQNLSAYEELAIHQMKQGSVIPEYSLQRGISQRKWKEGASAEMIEALFNVDVTKKEMITPSQAEKKGIPKEAMESFCERKETGFKIVRVSAATKAKETFNV